MMANNSFKVNRFQLLIGVVALLLGTLVYLVDRPPDQTYFVSNFVIGISLYNSLPNLFGFIGNSLPTFIHVFSFILITAGLITCHKKGYLTVCLSWFAVDCTFELGQKFSTYPLKIIPNWLTGISFLENTKNYFLQGTFDFNDLIAIAIGTVMAYLVLLTTMEKVKNEKSK